MQKRKVLRSRLEWLLVALASDRYDHVHTGNREFEADYVRATGASTYLCREGRARPRALLTDLTELVDRGFATQTVRKVKLQNNTINYSSFELTPEGRVEAAAIAAMV
jgi:hypothetical protein